MEDSTQFTSLPVYHKALEIFKVSRAIAYSLSEKQHVLEMGNCRDINSRFAGEIVNESLKLAPNLAAVQSTNNHSLRIKRAKRIRKVSRRILSTCTELEFRSNREKEFLKLLREEIFLFEKLFSDYFYTLQLKRKGS